MLYPQFDLYARKVIFPVPDEQVVAGIFVDLTREWKQQQEFQRLKHQAIQEVHQVVDKQIAWPRRSRGCWAKPPRKPK